VKGCSYRTAPQPHRLRSPTPGHTNLKYPDPDRPGQWKTRSKTFERKAEAQQWVDESLAEHRKNPQHRPPSDERFGAFMERWLTEVIPGHVHDTTVVAYRWYSQSLLAGDAAQKPFRPQLEVMEVLLKKLA